MKTSLSIGLVAGLACFMTGCGSTSGGGAKQTGGAAVAALALPTADSLSGTYVGAVRRATGVYKNDHLAPTGLTMILSLSPSGEGDLALDNGSDSFVLTLNGKGTAWVGQVVYSTPNYGEIVETWSLGVTSSGIRATVQINDEDLSGGYLVDFHDPVFFGSFGPTAESESWWYSSNTLVSGNLEKQLHAEGNLLTLFPSDSPPPFFIPLVSDSLLAGLVSFDAAWYGPMEEGPSFEAPGWSRNVYVPAFYRKGRNTIVGGGFYYGLYLGLFGSESERNLFAQVEIKVDAEGRPLSSTLAGEGEFVTPDNRWQVRSGNYRSLEEIYGSFESGLFSFVITGITPGGPLEDRFGEPGTYHYDSYGSFDGEAAGLWIPGEWYSSGPFGPSTFGEESEGMPLVLAAGAIQGNVRSWTVWNPLGQLLFAFEGGMATPMDIDDDLATLDRVTLTITHDDEGRPIQGTFRVEYFENRFFEGEGPESDGFNETFGSGRRLGTESMSFMFFNSDE